MLIKVRRKGFSSNKEEGSHISEEKVEVTEVPRCPPVEDQFEVVHGDVVTRSPMLMLVGKLIKAISLRFKCLKCRYKRDSGRVEMKNEQRDSS
ncbi:isocitrate dehydrogenase, NAD-dependent [Sesbania bispinosa]|nr:isocitrate dehydrogenase, NAD-dependent [Sesbania bispinosa]